MTRTVLTAVAPTPGRIVSVQLLGERSRPAIVLQVREGGRCDLCVFVGDPHQPCASYFNVPHIGEGAGAPCWLWPPRE